MDAQKLGALLREYVVDAPRRYWIEEPNAIGYRAFEEAGKKYGVEETEWTKADAAKHMAWQNELSRRTMLPQPYAGAVANTIGAVKEGYDAFSNRGSLDRMANSLMDNRNNFHGAFMLPRDGDPVAAAVRAAGQTTSDPIQSLLGMRPFSR